MLFTLGERNRKTLWSSVRIISPLESLSNRPTSWRFYLCGERAGDKADSQYAEEVESEREHGKIFHPHF